MTKVARRYLPINIYYGILKPFGQDYRRSPMLYAEQEITGPSFYNLIAADSSLLLEYSHLVFDLDHCTNPSPSGTIKNIPE